MKERVARQLAPIFMITEMLKCLHRAKAPRGCDARFLSGVDCRPVFPYHFRSVEICRLR